MRLLQLLKAQHKALVIDGPQGSGKSLLATQLAEAEGSYHVVGAEEICNSRFTPWMNYQPDTVIVDGDMTPELISALKPVIANHEMLHERKGQESIMVKTPTIIFCTIDSCVKSRRFYTIRLDA